MEKSYSESYAAAGVDITAGYRSVELMKQYVARTMNEHCIGGLGGFGGLFELDCTGYQAPGADLRHRRRGHQAEDRHDHGQARHHRHRLRGHVRQRRHLLPVQSRWSSSTTSPAAGTSPRRSPRSSRAWPRAACRPTALWWAARPPSIPGMMPEDEYDLAGFTVGVVDKEKILEQRDHDSPAT